MVTRLQGKIEQFLGHRHLAVAHEIEDRFHLMGEAGDIVETEHRPGSLDGVHGPENPADQVFVVRGILEFEQRGFQLGQKLDGLFPVGGDMLFHHGNDPSADIAVYFVVHPGGRSLLSPTPS